MAKEEEIFFVNISGADELRRELLESSKDIVEILKNYERFKSANEEKKKEIENLRLKIKEISRLIARLRSSLPLLKLKGLKKESGVKEKAALKEVKKATKKPESELDRLENELNEIESKLNSIS